jgi:hypothetical protein
MKLEIRLVSFPVGKTRMTNEGVSGDVEERCYIVSQELASARGLNRGTVIQVAFS